MRCDLVDALFGKFVGIIEKRDDTENNTENNFIFEKIKEFCLELNENVNGDSKLCDFLDDLDFVKLILHIEMEFDIDIHHDEDAEKLKTIGELVNLVQNTIVRTEHKKIVKKFFNPL